MIGFLRGEVLDSQDGKLLLAVSLGTSAIGYQVQVPQGPRYAFLHRGQTLEVWVHTHVREDALDLYGFLTTAEKELFLSLTTVSGIGPKVALGLLSKMEVGDFLRAVSEKDQAFLTSVPGVGKKTAERIVLELSDMLRKKIEAGVFGKETSQTISSATTARSMSAGLPGLDEGGSKIWRDAKEALIGLGYREHDVHSLLQKVKESEAEPPKKVEDVVRYALRQMSL